MLNGEILNSDKKFFSKIGSNYLIYVVSAIIIQIILINLFVLMKMDVLSDFNMLTILSAICNYILPFPILLFLMRKLESEELEKQSIGIKSFIRYIAIAFTLMWIGNIIGLVVSTLISAATPFDITNPVENLISSTDIWLNLVLISIIGPIFEEIIFRKLLIDRTIKYGAKISIILSALIFGFVHGNINQFFYAFLIGGFLAYVYIKTGKLIYPILLHITINLMGSVVSLFVGASAQNLISGQILPMDLAIVALYLSIILVAFLIGLYSLWKYRNVKLDHIKTKITLTQPFRTIILNYGMILFIGFCIFEIIYQVIR